MRLTCPNCKAQYEVTDTVIPQGGRDVQCSACGATWFQYPADVALRMRAADLEDDDDDEAQGAADRQSAERRIDRTVLDVLRQEAEREMTERRQARPSVATQGDLGLVGRPRPRSIDLGADPDLPARPGAAPPAARPAAPSSRRSLLPDIEAISPVIESTNARHAPDASPAEAAPKAPARPEGGGFGRGLGYAAVAAAVLVALYLLAPMVAETVPALRGPLAGYVTLVDQLRALVAGLLGG